LRATTPAVSVLHGFAFLRGGSRHEHRVWPLSWFACKLLPGNGWRRGTCARFTLRDPGAIDPQAQRILPPPMRDVQGKGLLQVAERAKVRHATVLADQEKQVLDRPCRRPKCHAQQELHRQACLDSSFAVGRLSAPLAGRRHRPPCRDQASLTAIAGNRPAANGISALPAIERLVLGWPVQGLARRCVRSAHDIQPSRWINQRNPPGDLYNSARETQNLGARHRSTENATLLGFSSPSARCD